MNSGRSISIGKHHTFHSTLLRVCPCHLMSSEQVPISLFFCAWYIIILSVCLVCGFVATYFGCHPNITMVNSNFLGHPYNREGYHAHYHLLAISFAYIAIAIPHAIFTFSHTTIIILVVWYVWSPLATSLIL